MRKQYVFGPIISRRLRISLGVDLVLPKTCSLDCIYCEARKTTELTCLRREYVPLDEVKAELSDVLGDSPELDYITFSGAGEPTLHSRIGELAEWLKSNYPQYRVCLLTNGTLLNDPDVLESLRYMDLVVPNFDASNAEELAVINRPAPGITVEILAAGIRQAAAIYPEKLVLELFIVPGVNDSPESISRFAGYIQTFAGIRQVQLNTLDRPGVVDWIKPADAAVIKRFIAALEPIVPVEAVGRVRYRSASLRKDFQAAGLDENILDLVRSRPLTAQDLAAALDCSVNEAQEHAEKLVGLGALGAEKQERGMFYFPV